MKTQIPDSGDFQDGVSSVDSVNLLCEECLPPEIARILQNVPWLSLRQGKHSMLQCVAMQVYSALRVQSPNDHILTPRQLLSKWTLRGGRWLGVQSLQQRLLLGSTAVAEGIC